MSKSIWTPSLNQIAQCSHFFIATTIVLVATLFGCQIWIGPMAVVAWLLPKEFVFDLLVEQETLMDSLEDAAWYLIGMVAATAFVWWL